ncbi:MAG: sugar ABC transporter permease [Christensenellales bacterium]|nr:sugar ABC transporter permease [Christensenellales bacterium]
MNPRKHVRQRRRSIAQTIADIVHGPWQVKLSVPCMGLGQLCYGQIGKGLVYLGLYAVLIWYFVAGGLKNIAGFFTLGTQQEDLWLGIAGENSMTLMILGLLSILIGCLGIVLWISNLRDCLFTAKQVSEGKKPRTFRESLAYAMDEKFHVTALMLPSLTVILFSVLPIVFMVLIAFTNMGGNVVYPVLADWSFSAWHKLVSVSKLASTFGKILSWNVLWAFLSTFFNFIAGLGLALLLNKPNVKGSKIWRAFPILAFSIPGFISMLGFKFMFSQSGPINSMLTEAGHDAIFFLTNDPSAKWWARGIGLFVSVWISCPSIMLMVTGLLGNINPDMYEASSLDGATRFQQFRKITLPFVIFSTTPVLIGQFVGNFNNFGIFFFMRGGVISNYADYFLASDTDLLINWLYNLSVNNNYYAIGAAISLVIFLITSTISLAVYVRSNAYKQEDTYQ